MSLVQTPPALGKFPAFPEHAPLTYNIHRGLQTRTALTELLNEVNVARKKVTSTSQATRTPKLVVKIAPDQSEPELLDIASVIRESEVDGVIVSNTTISRPSSLINSMFSSHPGKAPMLKITASE